MQTYTIGPLLALLPRRWRETFFSGLGVNWPRAAAVSGFVEGFAGIFGLAAWYIFYIQQALDRQAEIAAKALTQGPTPLTTTDVAAAMAIGSLIDFALHPVTWLLVFVAVEGTVRVLAAFIAEQPLGILPLAVFDRIILKTRQSQYEARVPLVRDLVTRGEGMQPWELKIESCRPKPAWKYPLTVRYKEAFFQVMSESGGTGTAQRPQVYLLRRVPRGEGFRGLTDYDPEEGLRSAAQPGPLAEMLAAMGEKLRIRMLPLVPDQVFPGEGKGGWDLKIESCRPRPGWSENQLLRYEGRFYRLEATYKAKSPRPFGFGFRLLPAGVSGRNVVEYSPLTVLRMPHK